MNNVNYLHLTWMNPFPAEIVKEVIQNSNSTLVIESNFSGQLSDLIKVQTGIEIKDKLLKSDGRPFFVEELEDEIIKRLKGLNQ